MSWSLHANRSILSKIDPILKSQDEILAKFKP
jgi:hypothetical protein